MKIQITNISVHQTSKIIAMLYAAFMLLLVPVGLILLVVGGDQRFLGVFFLVAPLIYGVMAYLMFGLTLLIYNFLAARFGGIEYSTTQVEAQAGTSIS